ncbi:hypothetical protein OS493_012319 [Desmophyllum pertusum]|uniref:Uncharacterized protein n=1 Tax=Desmophyllum pertusum TaxID=174260 RepID=A0A9W9ZQK0_9CNID|nr:hypothetical protein OS493_012319 [Desmophyllum pertusum]
MKRKLFSDHAFVLSPTKKRLVNQHMKHKETTADRNAMRSAVSHEIMRGIIEGRDETEPVKEDDERETAPEAAGSQYVDAEAHRNVEHGDSEDVTANVGVERGEGLEGSESPDGASVSSLSGLSVDKQGGNLQHLPRRHQCWEIACRKRRTRQDEM